MPTKYEVWLVWAIRVVDGSRTSSILQLVLSVLRNSYRQSRLMSVAGSIGEIHGIWPAWDEALCYLGNGCLFVTNQSDNAALHQEIRAQLLCKGKQPIDIALTV